MPIYEYCCQDCKHMFEEWQRDFTDREMPCPICGASAKRMISSTAFILKGSGWYATDYAQKSSNSSGNGQGGNGNGGASETKQADSGSSDSASSSKPESSESKPSSSSGEGS